ncbi:MAG: DUF2971 domain-containing protein [Limisphaerales bacterium]
MGTVFKFCGKYGLDILRNLELKITPPNQFNDPFEFTPRMICSDPLGCAKRDLARGPVLEELYKMCLSNGVFLGSFPEFQENVERERSKWEAILAEAPQQTLPLVEKEFLDRVSERFGVLCMSGGRDSILMWGHYCDKPLGLVIGFDRSASIFQQGKGLRPVVYDNKRVDYDSWWAVGSPEMAVFEERIILTKAQCWSYEAESRQIFPLSLSSLKKKPLNKNMGLWASLLLNFVHWSRTIGYFLPFPPSAIASVTLGPRCSPELEKEVGRILDKPCLAHVKRDRAVLHRDDFLLEFE